MFTVLHFIQAGAGAFAILCLSWVYELSTRGKDGNPK